MGAIGRQPGRAVAVNYLTTAKDISLSGDANGNVSFDGSANVAIDVVVADDSHNHVISNVDGLQDALDLKAPINNPAFTGSVGIGTSTPTERLEVDGTIKATDGTFTNDLEVQGIITTPTAALHTNTTQVATTAYVRGEITSLIDTAPTTLDTLNELAAALGDDPNFSNTVITLIGTKQDASTALTTSSSFGGDVSGTYNNIVVADDSHNHVISNVDGLQTALDGKLSTTGKAVDSDKLDGLDSSQFLRSDTDDTFTGTLTFSTYNDTIVRSGGTGGTDTTLWRCNGNENTTLNSADLGFSIKYMGSRSGNENSYSIFSDNRYSATQVEAFTIKQDGTLWQGLTNKIWHAGNDGSGSGLDADLLDGQHGSYYQPASTALTTSSSFGGDVSGTYNAIVVADDSHNHVISNVDGLQTALDAKLASSSYTASDVLAKIKTVDGSGSGLDADLLDGKDSTDFSRQWSAHNNTSSGSGYAKIASISGGQSTRFKIEIAGTSGSYYAGVNSSYGVIVGQVNNDNNIEVVYYNHAYTSEPASSVHFVDTGSSTADIYVYLNTYAGLTATGSINNGTLTPFENQTPVSSVANLQTASEVKVWHAGNDGSGSGLDADTVDGLQASSFLRSDQSDSMTGDLTITGTLSATSKSFLIDHPTKEGKRLRYGSLEGPENGVYIRGKVEDSVIELPEYWVELVDKDSITVTLTPIGKHQKLYVEDIRDNKVYISNASLLNKKIKSFYVVYGERKDIPKLEVEID